MGGEGGAKYYGGGGVCSTGGFAHSLGAKKATEDNKNTGRKQSGLSWDYLGTLFMWFFLPPFAGMTPKEAQTDFCHPPRASVCVYVFCFAILVANLGHPSPNGADHRKKCYETPCRSDRFHELRSGQELCFGPILEEHSGPGWDQDGPGCPPLGTWMGPKRCKAKHMANLDGTASDPGWDLDGPGSDPSEGLDGTPRDSNRLLGLSHFSQGDFQGSVFFFA